MDEKWNIETKAVQAGWQPKDGESRIVPIVQSTTFKYDNAQSVADLFDLKRPGHFYTRLSNPTVEAFENKICAMEGGVGAVAGGHDGGTVFQCHAYDLAVEVGGYLQHVAQSRGQEVAW